MDRPEAPRGWGRQRARDDIKDAENAVLRPWNSVEFTQISLAVCVALALFFVLVVGPPPSDPRCTLGPLCP